MVPVVNVCIFTLVTDNIVQREGHRVLKPAGGAAGSVRKEPLSRLLHSYLAASCSVIHLVTLMSV